MVIRGGTVVTDSWSGAATVTVAGGRISGVLDPGGRGRGAEALDATGMLVMPGGVDPHCHVGCRWGSTSPGTASSPPVAALAGGTTTIVDFAIPAPARARSRCSSASWRGQDSRCDYAIHGCVNAPGRIIAAVVRPTSRRASGR